MSLQNQVVHCSNHRVILYKEVKQFGQQKEKQHIGYFKRIVTDPDPHPSQNGDGWPGDGLVPKSSHLDISQNIREKKDALVF